MPFDQNFDIDERHHQKEVDAGYKPPIKTKLPSYGLRHHTGWILELVGYDILADAYITRRKRLFR